MNHDSLSTSYRYAVAKRIAAGAACVCLAVSLTACASGAASSASSGAPPSSAVSSAASSTPNALPTVTVKGNAPQKSDIATNETVENSADGEHAVQADATSGSYSNITVSKTGDSNSGDEADFYGDNAAVFATNGATLDLSQIVVESAGTHANGVFSYGEGTTVNIADSVIETTGNCSGGLMTTGGATMNASNLRVLTSGNSSAAIRSDRGGGTVNVKGGIYATSGTGSPAIYSTADIAVSDASLQSTASQGVVVEGKNSVSLNNVQLVADNNTKNSDKSDFYQAVMIYQSMSGDAAQGEATFAMNGGSLENANGDVFFVNNTVATIELAGASIVNNGGGAFLRAAAAGWGTEGSNGGQVTLRAANQQINGDMLVDSVSHLNLYLSEGSSFKGAINPSGQEGEVYVELAEGTTWTLEADSYITSLTCAAGSIDLNGHTLYVNGQAYDANTASQGTAIEVKATSAGGPGGGEAPDGAPDGSGGPGSGGAPSGNPPAKPSGEAPSGTPPEKPSEKKS